MALLVIPYAAVAQEPPKPPSPPGPPTPPNPPPPPAPGQPIPPPEPPKPAEPVPPPAKPDAEAKPEGDEKKPSDKPKAAEPAKPAAPAKPAKPAEPTAQASVSPRAEVGASAETSTPAPIFIDETAPGGDHWFEAFDLTAFVDAYASFNFNVTKPQEGPNGFVRAYDTANGFSLAWAGLDLSYPAEPVGGMLSLRFGPAAERHNATCLGSTCDTSYGLQFVSQAFASWRPGGADGAVRLDFGKFSSDFGGEVAESQHNINYTRGVLYWLGQPRFHTGLRVVADLSEHFSVRGIAANGWNNTIDNNLGKTAGAQLTYHLPNDAGSDLFSVTLGYLVGPERDDTLQVNCGPGQVFDPNAANGCRAQENSPGGRGTIDRDTSNTKGLRHLADVIVTAEPSESLRLLLNGSFGSESLRSASDPSSFTDAQWWGVGLAARYAFTGEFAVGARGEYYRDDDGLTTRLTPQAIDIVTGTLTLDFLPTDNLIVRLDGRLDWSNYEIFQKELRDLTGTQITTTLGVVATTN